MTALADWLSRLDPERLADVLRLRPDACAPPHPGSLTELADRLSTWHSVRQAQGHLDVRGLQVAEVLQALGEAVSRDRLAALLGRAVAEEELDGVLAELERLALAWPGEEGRWYGGGSLHLVAAPLGLGAPAADLLAGVNADELRRMAANLGLRAASRKQENFALLVRALSDPDAVRNAVAAAPKAARELLHRTALKGPTVSEPGLYGYGRRDSAATWALDRGLLVRRDWLQVEMPREVGLALRGADWHPVLAAPPPPVPYADAPVALVERAEVAAAGAAVGAATAVLDAVAAEPLAALKSGGVGTRELRRLAKALRLTEDDVVLWLDLAGAAGLVGQHGAEVLATAAYDAWRAQEPGPRLVPLLAAWRDLPWAPTSRTDAAGRTVAALAPPNPARVMAAARLREGVLEAAGARPERGIADPEALAGRLAWERPLTYPPEQVLDRLARDLARASLREAELLGVIAAGALTGLGRALLAGSPGELDGRARELLPAAATAATFQADLTAVVSGTPSAALAELLGRVADLETRAAASVWRFSPASVRRAFDAGATAVDLLRDLAAVAPRGLPQPLTYLVGDVARRHGQLRVAPVACVVCGEEALVAEIAVARALAPLGLRRLAPTVLGSGRAVEEVLRALRAAGYAPVGESAEGATRVERAPRRRVPPPRPGRRSGSSPHRLSQGLAQRSVQEEPADAEELVRRLLTPPSPSAAASPSSATVIDLTGRSPREAALARHMTHLHPAEAALLRHALQSGDAVEILYVDQDGRTTQRVIDELELDDQHVVGWCHLRDDERRFSLKGIRAVAPAP